MGFLDKAKQRCKATCGGDPETCVPDEEQLSQYGEDGEFRSAPRVWLQEPGLSIQRGYWDAEHLSRQVLGDPPPERLELADARYTTAGALRKAGFEVIHTPGRYGYQADHATVAWEPIVDDDGTVVPWTTQVTERFNKCFN